MMRIQPPEEEALGLIEPLFVTGRGPAAEQVRLAVQDSYKRLLGPAIEVEMRIESKKRADVEAIRVFCGKPARAAAGLAAGTQERAGHRPRLPHRLQNRLPRPAGQAAAQRCHLPDRLLGGRSARSSGGLAEHDPQISDRGHRHRQRHGGPRDRDVRQGAQAPGLHPGGHGQRKRRFHLFRLRSGARGISRPGPHRARRGLHRPPAHGPAGRTGEARSQVDRRGPVSARRGSVRPQAQPRRRGDELRQRRGRGTQHRQQAIAHLCLRPRPGAGGKHRGLPQRERPLQVARRIEAGARAWGPRPSSRPPGSCASATANIRWTPARCIPRAIPSWIGWPRTWPVR